MQGQSSPETIDVPTKYEAIGTSMVFGEDFPSNLPSKFPTTRIPPGKISQSNQPMYIPYLDYDIYIYIHRYIYHIIHVGAKPHVRPHRKNTLKQYCIRVIGGGMKTLAVRRDFDCCFVGFRVLI